MIKITLKDGKTLEFPEATSFRYDYGIHGLVLSKWRPAPPPTPQQEENGDYPPNVVRGRNSEWIEEIPVAIVSTDAFSVVLLEYNNEHATEAA